MFKNIKTIVLASFFVFPVVSWGMERMVKVRPDIGEEVYSCKMKYRSTAPSERAKELEEEINKLLLSGINGWNGEIQKSRYDGDKGIDVLAKMTKSGPGNGTIHLAVECKYSEDGWKGLKYAFDSPDEERVYQMSIIKRPSISA